MCVDMCVLDISQAWEVYAANRIPLWSYRDLMGGCKRDGLQLTSLTGNRPFYPISRAKIPRPANHNST